MAQIPLVWPLTHARAPWLPVAPGSFSVPWWSARLHLGGVCSADLVKAIAACRVGVADKSYAMSQSGEITLEQTPACKRLF